jgi:NADPH2:quinone reductase
MNRAVIADALGPPETYVLRPCDLAPPGPGQIRVAVKAIGVSYVDVLTAAGRYQVKPQTPFIPGSECAGVVQAIGDGVAHLAVGDRVMGSGLGGFFVETGIFPATRFNRVPDCLSLEAAAVFPPSYAAAYHALADRGRLQPGETLLVLGAAGAMGIAAIQLGKSLGARVIASASSAQKRALCLEAGANAVIDTRGETWRDEVKAAADNRPIDVVFDPVGGGMTEPAFRTLGYDGRYLVIGFTGGIAEFRTNLPLIKTASLIGVQFRAFVQAEPERALTNMAKCVDLAGQRKLRPIVGRVYPFEEFRKAMTAAFNGSIVGRVVMRVD